MHTKLGMAALAEGGRTKLVRTAILAVALAALVVPAASGSAAVTQTSAVPSKLVGRWTRTVTATDLKREDTTDLEARSVWTLTIKKSGAASIHQVGQPAAGPGNQGASFTGPIVAAGAHRVHIYVDFTFPNVYGWRVSRRLLTLTKISDSFAARAALFTGVWRRK